MICTGGLKKLGVREQFYYRPEDNNVFWIS
jgi:hypothetical protein